MYYELCAVMVLFRLCEIHHIRYNNSSNKIIFCYALFFRCLIIIVDPILVVNVNLLICLTENEHVILDYTVTVETRYNKSRVTMKIVHL
jgi:hypothetical protein